MRELNVFGGVKGGFDFGDDGGLVVVQRLENQAIRGELVADIPAGLQHQLVDILSIMDAGGDLGWCNWR